MKILLRIALALLIAIGIPLLWIALSGSDDAAPTVPLVSAPTEQENRDAALAPQLEVHRRSEVPLIEIDVPRSSLGAAIARDLIVRVVDANLEPVDDVHVHLWTALTTPNERGGWHLYDQTFTAGGDLPRHGMRIPADAIAAAFLKEQEARASGREAEVYVCAPDSLVKCTHLKLDEAELPDRDIELVLDGSGFLRVAVLRPDGSPFEKHTGVSLSVDPKHRDATFPLHLRTKSNIWNGLSSTDGRWRVPLQKTLRVFIAIPPNSEWIDKSEKLPGPVVEGEEVVLKVYLRNARMLAGRLVSTIGEPLVQQHVQFHCKFARGVMSLCNFKTDAEGRFRVSLQVTLQMRQVEQMRFFPTESGSSTQNASELENHPHAVLESIELPESALADLGDIVVQPSPKHFLVSGLVVDSAGTPIENAFLYAWTGSPPQRIDPEVHVSDSQGRFEIYSRTSISNLSLVAEKKGYVRQRIDPVAIGDRSVRIVLGSGGVIAGRVLLPEGFPTQLKIHRVFKQGTQQTLQPNAEGEFRFEGCDEGSHTLAFQLRPWPPVLELADFIVDGEAQCSDPRLREIDLRSFVSTVRVLALDMSGKPLVERNLQLSPDGSMSIATHVRTDATGRLRFGLPAAVQAIALSLPQGLPSVVLCSGGEQVVRLSEPLRLLLELAPDAQLPEGTQLFASAALEDPNGAPTHSPLFTSRPSNFVARVTSLSLPLAGRYQLKWSVTRSDVPQRMVFLETADPYIIDVAPITKEQRITVSPPLGALHAALATLGR